jgi:hypothetical protein
VSRSTAVGWRSGRSIASRHLVLTQIAGIVWSQHSYAAAAGAGGAYVTPRKMFRRPRRGPQKWLKSTLITATSTVVRVVFLIIHGHANRLLFALLVHYVTRPPYETDGTSLPIARSTPTSQPSQSRPLSLPKTSSVLDKALV